MIFLRAFRKIRDMRLMHTRAKAWIRGWMTELGFVSYKPGPWNTKVWNSAYDSGQLDYFQDLTERPRYSVLIGYLNYIEEVESLKLGKILDVGCGDGLLFERSKEIGYAEWIGVDLSSVAVEQACARYEKLKSEQHLRKEALFIAADLLGTHDIALYQSFDVVIISEVIYMSDDPDRLLKTCREALKPGGFLLISMWRHRGDKRLWRQVLSYFVILDAVQVTPGSSALAPRGWRLAMLTARP